MLCACLRLSLSRSDTLAVGSAALRVGHVRSVSTQSVPVPLKFDKLVPQNGNEKEEPLVVVHGLFGMKRNWQSLSKAFLTVLGRPVYVLDLRNHGSSPHAEPMTYSAMAEDVLHFCKEQSLERISLLGHSMGGKVAMATALSPALPDGLLKHLIVADIAPSKGALSPEFQSYIQAMKRIEESNITSRSEAQHIMKEYEPDVSVRNFLLTNLHASHGHHPLRFKVPLDILGHSIGEIGGFPYEPGERTWNGPTLFIKGTKSKYINKHDEPIARQFFPNTKFELLEAGHWVHAEKPHEFLNLVFDFTRTN